MHGSLIATRERRTRLRRMMALEIEEAPEFLRLYSRAAVEAARQPVRSTARRAMKPEAESATWPG